MRTSAEIRQALTEALLTVPGLAVFGFRADTINPPAVVVDFWEASPLRVEPCWLQTHWPLTVVLGRSNEQQTTELVDQLVLGDDAEIPAALLASPELQRMQVRIVDWRPPVPTPIGGGDYVGAQVVVEVTG